MTTPSTPLNVSSPSAPTIPPDFAPIVTSQLIGSLLNLFFFGTLVVQVYVYRLCFPTDNLGLKMLVYYIFLVMLACTLLNIIDTQYWFGDGFGDIVRFGNPHHARFYTPLMGSFVAMLVQLFLAVRIVRLKRSAWPVAVFIGLLALAQCAGGMGCGILGYINEAKLLNLTQTWRRGHLRTILVYLWLIGGGAADMLIAFTMSYLVLTAKVLPTSRDCVKNVVRLLIETNTLTAVVAIIGLSLYLGMQNTTYFVCPTMILPGLSANTMLVVLNNRRRPRDEDAPLTVPLSSRPVVPTINFPARPASRDVMKEKEYHYSRSGSVEGGERNQWRV
ncbi:hypothetical protein FB45DRAFT_1064357 [Roridomyces roridus]|uniref:DUF6534 domain-containing protein n=1 Tax=Roridomyces roridus TaxID=1738132 RepID=A0AAD7BB79_9AGAR|nr:hypothetical protein FB45DRAFT_1064357 [Roridomyces roridus]